MDWEGDTNVSEEHIPSTFRAEDEGTMFLPNIGIYRLQVQAASQPKDQHRQLHLLTAIMSSSSAITGWTF
jgi:hypothetical protein